MGPRKMKLSMSPLPLASACTPGLQKGPGRKWMLTTRLVLMGTLRPKLNEKIEILTSRRLASLENVWCRWWCSLWIPTRSALTMRLEVLWMVVSRVCLWETAEVSDLLGRVSGRWWWPLLQWCTRILLVALRNIIP